MIGGAVAMSDMHTLRVALVDDEQDQLDLLASYVRRFASDEGFNVALSAFHNGFDLMAEGEQTLAGRFDLILLDIQMGDMADEDMNGIAVARAIRRVDRDVRLIFVTNLEQYAIQGYSVRAMDFVVKPLSYEQFAEKMRVVAEEVFDCDGRSIMLRGPEGMVRVAERDVVAVEIIHRKAYIHTVRGDFASYGALNFFERFFRCHSSVLVNLRFVEEVGRESLRVRIPGGVLELPVSRRRRPALMECLTNELGNMR